VRIAELATPELDWLLEDDPRWGTPSADHD